jgi:hypothetical protein
MALDMVRSKYTHGELFTEQQAEQLNEMSILASFKSANAAMIQLRRLMRFLNVIQADGYLNEALVYGHGRETVGAPVQIFYLKNNVRQWVQSIRRADKIDKIIPPLLAAITANVVDRVDLLSEENELFEVVGSGWQDYGGEDLTYNGVILQIRCYDVDFFRTIFDLRPEALVQVGDEASLSATNTALFQSCPIESQVHWTCPCTESNYARYRDSYNMIRENSFADGGSGGGLGPRDLSNIYEARYMASNSGNSLGAWSLFPSPSHRLHYMNHYRLIDVRPDENLWQEYLAINGKVYDELWQKLHGNNAEHMRDKMTQLLSIFYDYLDFSQPHVNNKKRANDLLFEMPQTLRSLPPSILAHSVKFPLTYPWYTIEKKLFTSKILALKNSIDKGESVDPICDLQVGFAVTPRQILEWPFWPVVLCRNPIYVSKYPPYPATYQCKLLGKKILDEVLYDPKRQNIFLTSKPCQDDLLLLRAKWIDFAEDKNLHPRTDGLAKIDPPLAKLMDQILTRVYSGKI